MKVCGLRNVMGDANNLLFEFVDLLQEEKVSLVRELNGAYYAAQRSLTLLSLRSVTDT